MLTLTVIVLASVPFRRGISHTKGSVEEEEELFIV
jgi:hypothetical protein